MLITEFEQIAPHTDNFDQLSYIGPSKRREYYSYKLTRFVSEIYYITYDIQNKSLFTRQIIDDSWYLCDDSFCIELKICVLTARRQYKTDEIYKLYSKLQIIRSIGMHQDVIRYITLNELYNI